MSGACVGDRLADGGRLGQVDIGGKVDLGVGELSRQRTLLGDLRLALLGVGGDDGGAGVLGVAVLVGEPGVHGGEELLHAGGDGGVVDALVGAEDDRSRRAAGAELGEVLLEHVEAVGALGVGDGGGRVVGGADRAGGAEDDDQGGEPDADGRLAVVDSTRRRCGPRRGRWPSGQSGVIWGCLTWPTVPEPGRTAVAGRVVFRLRTVETGLNRDTTRCRMRRNRPERTLGSWKRSRSKNGARSRCRFVCSVASRPQPTTVNRSMSARRSARPCSPCSPCRPDLRSRSRASCGWCGARSPPRTADKTLQSYVTRLRKGLGADSIVRTGVAYRLDVTAASVDVVRFQRLLGVDDTEAALAEWTGTPLAGLDADGLTATVDGLVEQYLGVVETDLGRRIEADAHAVIGSLTELTATYPFREGLWALLMTALYRVGRQADALAAYRRAREHLVEGLGVEPGPRLRELESLILGQDEQLGVNRSSMGSALGVPSGTVTFGFSDVEDSTGLWAAHRREMASGDGAPRRSRHGRGRSSRRLHLRHGW